MEAAWRGSAGHISDANLMVARPIPSFVVKQFVDIRHAGAQRQSFA